MDYNITPDWSSDTPGSTPDSGSQSSTNTTGTPSAATPGAESAQPSGRTILASGSGITTFAHSDLNCYLQLPYPGIVIFVHGVNSEGEWFQAAEEGLCRGLNQRLGRAPGQLVSEGKAVGQLAPAHYTPSLSPDGFINPKLLVRNYQVPEANTYSPVIHFRWGYKADKEDLKEYGDKVFLNEQNYWGGGPFANGCGSLADLWNLGIDPCVFLFLNVQGLNPTNRPVYKTPPRTYNLVGALRLAKLVQAIREEDTNTPITMVCHSQGNMVGIAAAFLGEQMSKNAEWNPKNVRCVTDTYVLANAPYSLLGLTPGDESTFMDDYTQWGVKDDQGNFGRVTSKARAETLKKFFDLIAKDAGTNEDCCIDPETAKQISNLQSGADGLPLYEPATDRQRHGLRNQTYGRVTLYSCPHDQVISAATVKGIGWRGISAEELALMNVDEKSSFFTQRVFASGWKVGDKDGPPVYRAWQDDWRAGLGENRPFFYPLSLPTRFSLKQNIRASDSVVGKVTATAFAPILYIVTYVTASFNKLLTNGVPPRGWQINCNAPALPQPFYPVAIRFNAQIKPTRDGNATSIFNEDIDVQAASRAADKSDKKADGPYDQYQPSNNRTLPNGQNYKDASRAQGDADSEAGQRYEDHAILRMNARHENRSDWVVNNQVVGEAGPDATQPEGYKEWHDQQITNILDSGYKNSPSNHSIIMTNPEHAEKALAYDVAIGMCRFSDETMSTFRLQADWRFANASLKADNKDRIYVEYFKSGNIEDKTLATWIKTDGQLKLPADINDTRAHPPHLVTAEKNQ